MAELVAFPKQPAAPDRSSWAAFKPAIREVLEAAHCHAHMMNWIVADIERRWPTLFADHPPLSLQLAPAKAHELKEFIGAMSTAHLKSVLLLEIELYQAIHRAPNGGVRITRAG
jgi:hypothetical protein